MGNFLPEKLEVVIQNPQRRMLMPRGGQAWDGEIIKAHHFNGGGSYEYRLVTWGGQPRIAIRWNRGGGVANMPQGIRTSVTLDVALYPAIIGQILPLNVRNQTRAFLGPDLVGGNNPNAMQHDPNQNYRHPQQVSTPQDLLGPFRVVVNKGPGDCAYTIGMWGKQGRRNPVIAFRWNGTEADPRGFPISRGGLPSWIVLPDDLGAGFSGPGPFADILPPNVQDPVIRFLTGQLDLL